MSTPELLSRAGGAVAALSRATKTFQIFQNVHKIPEMRVGTFNVRGMSSKVKQTQLASDMLAYRLDFCGLQETKIAEPLDRMVSEQHRFVNFGQVEGRHGGTGFVVSKRLEPCLTQYKKLSDRVGYADFVIPSGGKSKNVIDVRFIVAYGPTTPSVQKDSNLLEKFYDTLSRAQLTKKRRMQVYTVGDFNSKVGNGTESCVGKYSKGTRNGNGQALVDWACSQRLLLANTCFRYSMRHRTTWTGHIRDGTTGLVKPIYNMIDFVLIPHLCRPLLRRARSYAGTEVASDHKLVIAVMEFSGLYSIHNTVPKKKKNIKPVLAVRQLQNPQSREQFTTALETKHANLEIEAESASSMWQKATKIIIEAAESSLGTLHRTSRGKYIVPCTQVSELSKRQRAIRLQLESGTPNSQALKKERNQILHQIREIQLTEANARLDKIAESIENAPDSVAMFKAAKLLQSNKNGAVIVESSDGHVLARDSDRGDRIMEHFRQQFSPQTVDPLPLPSPHTMNNPISKVEVERAVKRLQNQKACGPDDIPGELLKYGGDVVTNTIATIINQGVTNGEDMAAVIGQGTLIALQKPNKPKGPATSLRPIVLLNTVRKVMSLIVLGRISTAVSAFLGPTSSGFRAGRSTADVLWTQRWMAAKCQRYRCSIHMLGLDMSKAFDTISREKLLQVMAKIVHPDELHLIHLLLY